MPFQEQNFGLEEILTSAKMSQMDLNIDEVRRSHKGSSSPPSPRAGVLWVDDSATPWSWKMYDGTDWIELGKINPNSNSSSLGGPSRIVAPQSLSGGTHDEQSAVLAGLSAWKLVLKDVDPGTGRIDVQFYNDGTLIAGAGYFWRGDSAGVTALGGARLTSSIRVVPSMAAVNTLHWGEIDIWIDADNKVRMKWNMLENDAFGTNTAAHWGWGFNSGAYTSVDGFRLSTNQSFTAGTLAVYSIPQWVHS
jgi:hypothetical protein